MFKMKKYIDERNTVEKLDKMNNFFVKKLLENSKEFPNRVAIKYKDNSVSYGELEVITNKMVSFLCNRICEEQVPIIIYHTRGIEFIEWMIAILKCNCYYIPMENIYPADRVRKIVSVKKFTYFNYKSLMIK